MPQICFLVAFSSFHCTTLGLTLRLKSQCMECLASFPSWNFQEILASNCNDSLPQRNRYNQLGFSTLALRQNSWTMHLMLSCLRRGSTNERRFCFGFPKNWSVAKSHSSGWTCPFKTQLSYGTPIILKPIFTTAPTWFGLKSFHFVLYLGNLRQKAFKLAFASICLRKLSCKFANGHMTGIATYEKETLGIIMGWKDLHDTTDVVGTWWNDLHFTGMRHSFYHVLWGKNTGSSPVSKPKSYLKL